MTNQPNHPAAGKTGIARQLAIGRPRPAARHHDVLPVRAEDWRRLLALPFKTYMLMVPFVVIACRIVERFTGQELPENLRYGAATTIAQQDQQLFLALAFGYTICALALLVIGIGVLKETRSRRSALRFSVAGMAVLPLFLLLSHFAQAKTRGQQGGHEIRKLKSES